MTFQKNHIITLLDNISVFASDNLSQILPLDLQRDNEIESFYIGYIQRQHALITDLSILFKYKESTYLSSQHILFRCIVDDYIHITYIVNQTNPENLIINYNADAVRQNYNKLKELADFNESQLEGKYSDYPTEKIMDDLKLKLKETQNHYFCSNGEFKKFDSTGVFIKKLKQENYAHKLIRAYYFLRRYSDFIHYSNFSNNLEKGIKPEHDSTYLEFAEIIQYSYRVIRAALAYFENKYSITVIDKKNLSSYYKDTEH